MNDFIKKIGVSPAYLVSAYGKDFSPDDVCHAIEAVNSMGYSSLQIEIYTADKLPLWLEGGGSKKINQASKQIGLNINQLVCHLLINEFTTVDNLTNYKGIEIFKQLIELGTRIDCCNTLVLPIGTFIEWNSIESSFSNEDKLLDLFLNKYLRFYDLIKNTDFQLSLELLPASIIGNYYTLNRQFICPSLGKVGILFDTGHAWANGEDVVKIPFLYGKQIFGTHLCDNFGTESLSLTPGKGNIDWAGVIKNLVTSNYCGFFDIEIICNKHEVEEEYHLGLDFIKSKLFENTSNKYTK